MEFPSVTQFNAENQTLNYGPESKELAGKVAVVAGASKGIGAAIAKAHGAADAAVVANYSSSREGADGVVAAINPGIVETEGTHSAGITESDSRKQAEASTPLGRTTTV
jgi:NAD(P)-dependent dehydrogenase (short-subunit alcohol dehydrogenase family)